jgi:asparagine synthase (glutamine-hydrolysing)
MRTSRTSPKSSADATDVCGIAGIVERGRPADPGLVSGMRDRLTHRGPDDAGTWCEDNVGLGHRRLSIIDLSAHGHQPMASACGRWVVVYNGEIYNFDALRAELPGVSWRGHSDTEVLLAAVAAWGIEATLPRLSGIYAFALYDRERRELVLARDALGVKPLYYGWCGPRFVFASELRAFDVLPQADRHVDRNALASYLRASNVPAPLTIYAGMAKLVPGTYVRIDARDPSPGVLPSPVTFWSARRALERPVATGRTSAEYDEEALALLRGAVARQLVADVPVGAFLSGGIDSSIVVALMQEQASRPVKTFTIGFEQAAFDEAPAAKRVAEHLGTDHTELVMTERTLLDTVDELPALCDEPFGDSSILPTFLVSRLARRDVTVCLSGDGGDELFWGYTRYPLSESVFRGISRIPLGLRSVAARILRTHSARAVARHLPIVGWPGRGARVAHRFDRLADALEYREQSAVFLDFMSHWKAPDAVVLGGHEAATVYRDPAHWTTTLPMWRRMAVQDLLAYLPDDILTKVDRASMRVGLESRVPLLDERLVEFALTLPESEIRGGGEPKRMLKRLLARYVPRELTDRPKQGFGVPMGEWLRGPLRTWAGDLLARDRLVADGFFAPAPILAKFEQHLAGEADWSAWLWDVLMFQSWWDARRRGGG